VPTIKDRMIVTFNQSNISSWIVIIFGKNPRKGGNPAIDITDKKNLTKIVFLIIRVLILLIEDIFNIAARYVTLNIIKK